MGCCLSKTNPTPNPKCQQNDLKMPQKVMITQVVEDQTRKKIAAIETTCQREEEKKKEDLKTEEKAAEVAVKKKEVFVIHHRKSNDKRPDSKVGSDSDGSQSNCTNSSDLERENNNIGIGSNILASAASGQVVRTSSCTKEEVDAILIQCGRLSRSSSGKGNGHGRRYSGSKRSYDFDRENDIDGSKIDEPVEINGEDDERLRCRHSRGSNRRRASLSRSRERDQQQQRSGSRERAQSGSGRRVSRSPGRRSESPMTNNGNTSSSSNGNGRPGKLVSVPATVTSFSMDKSSTCNGNGQVGGDSGNVQRVLVKRNVGSPRSQSPARGNQANGNGGNQQQQPSLSPNGSRKAEQSPYRRTPLNEIDMNSLPFQPLANKRPPQKGKDTEEDILVVVKQPLNSVSQNKFVDTSSVKVAAQGTHRRTSSRGAEGYEFAKTNYCRMNELQTQNVDRRTKGNGEQLNTDEYDAMVTPVILSGTETLKLPQTLVRSRSSRRSRDLDINFDALLTPSPATNYNSLLLQDIQNFHQNKNSNSNTDTHANANANANANNSTNNITSNVNTSMPFTLPPCVSNACSILEAVADLNSTTASNLSVAFGDDRWISPRATTQIANKIDTKFSFDHHDKKRLETKDPLVESEVKVGGDLMEPSLHKYVTVRKRGGDMDDEESSGSNSFVGGGIQQKWVSSSSWEPNSADSTDCWTSKSYTQEEGFSPLRFERHAISDFACGNDEEYERKLIKNGREQSDEQQAAVTRARSSVSRGPIQTSRAAAAPM